MTTTQETAGAILSVAEEARRSTSSLLGKAGTDTAQALHSAASVVRDAGNQSAAVIDGLADGAGQRLASASMYVGGYDADGMVHDIKRMVRRHPGPVVLMAAAMAAAIGYIAGTQSSRLRG